MKTEEKNQATVQAAAVKAAETVNRIPNRPSIPGKEARNDQVPNDQKPSEVGRIRLTRRVMKLRAVQPLEQITNRQTIRSNREQRK